MLEAVRTGLEELISIHRRNPLDLLYESDLQAFLFMKLRESISETIELTPDVLPPDSFAAPGRMVTSLVHTEYPSTKRFDVAVIDCTLVQSTAQYRAELGGVELKNESVWGQRVRVAVELKQVHIGGDLIAGLQRLRQDLTKLQDYSSYCEKAPSHSRFAGIAVLFVQSCSATILEQIKRQRIFTVAMARVEVAEGASGYIVTPTECFRVGWP
jgi:hypothetical protein